MKMKYYSFTGNENSERYSNELDTSGDISGNCQNKDIVIFGGTFDPIHVGHLIIAEQARSQFSLDEILFLPAGDPPHKQRRKVTSAEIRLEMTQEATRDNSGFNVSSREIKRDTPSFTAKTLDELIREGYFVSLIMGADSLAEIFTWRRPEFILKNARLLVAPRPGYNIEAMRTHKKYQQFSPEIAKIDCVFMDISSSLIRRRVKNDRTIRYLVPSAAEKIIQREELYSLDREE